MPKKVTRKDVLYALQFGGERLLKTFIQGGGANPDAYTLSKTGIVVDRGIARELLGDPHVAAEDAGLLPGISQSFAWRD